MIVKQVKDAVFQWVTDKASKMTGFYGAYFCGSINWMPDDAQIPPASDVDIEVVFEGSNAPDEHRKFLYRDVVFEVSYAPASHFQSPELILGDYPTACHFSTSSIIADPSGQLTKVQKVVSLDYAKRKWVYKRCEDARERLLTMLQELDESAPFHDQVSAWLFANVMPTHIVLMAGLKDPTVRKCFVASREVLAKYDSLQVYDSMLDILGCTQWSRAQAEFHLTSLGEVFDVCKKIVKTPFYFSTNISDLAHPAMIGGSNKLIESGYHREAVFWIAVVYSWCQKILFNDASEETQNQFTPGYRLLLSELGINSFSDLQERNDRNRDNLPVIWSIAEAIIASNPDVTD
jgi:hypothetical protein